MSRLESRTGGSGSQCRHEILGIWRPDGFGSQAFFKTVERSPMAKMTVRWLVAALLACVLGLMLSACGSSNFVADNWPHFAGGEPNDVPPRPGTPGYAAFIAREQPAEPPKIASPQSPPGGVTPEFVARQPGVSGHQVPAGTATATPAQQPAGAAPPQGRTDQNVGQGGLY